MTLLMVLHLVIVVSSADWIEASALVWFAFGWVCLLQRPQGVNDAITSFRTSISVLLPIVLLFFWLLLSAVGARFLWDIPQLSLRSVAFESRWWPFFVVAWPALGQFYAHEFRWPRVFLLVSAALGGVSLGQFFGLIPVPASTAESIWWGSFATFTPQGFFASPTTFSLVHAILFLFVFAGWAGERASPRVSRWQGLAIGAGLSVAFLGLVATLNIVVLIATGVALSFLVLLAHRRVMVAIPLVAVVVLIGSIATIPRPCGDDRVCAYLERQINWPEQKVVWVGHLLIFRDNPLFGVGLGQTASHVERHAKHKASSNEQMGSARNALLELLTGAGALGSLLGIFVVAQILRVFGSGLKIALARSAVAAGSAVLVMGLVASLYSELLLDSTVLHLWLLLLILPMVSLSSAVTLSTRVTSRDEENTGHVPVPSIEPEIGLR
jgi:hypothetical protein